MTRTKSRFLRLLTTKQFRDTVYQIKATEGLQVLVPARLIGELRSLPEEVLSATEAVDEAMLSRYTNFTLGNHADLLSTLVRCKLSQNLARLVPQLKSELEYVVATEFPNCKGKSVSQIFCLLQLTRPRMDTSKVPTLCAASHCTDQWSSVRRP